MYKEDLALYKLQWFICHKTQVNQTKPNYFEAIQKLMISNTNQSKWQEVMKQMNE